MSTPTMAVWLAALLHDVGKFWKRAGHPGPHHEASANFIDESKSLFPDEWLSDLKDAVGHHHEETVGRDVEKVVQVADRLASEEKKLEAELPLAGEVGEIPLMPAASRVELRYRAPQEPWGFRLGTLELAEKSIFPVQDTQVTTERYDELWQNFTAELGQLGVIDSPLQLITLIAVLRKYLTFMPAVTPVERDEDYYTLPDISLFDHLKATCAIVACLERLNTDKLDALYRGDAAVQEIPIALMLRADFSGIQSFIYRITEPEAEAEYRGAAKRLRGRSFYLSLLEDVVADWLIRELELPVANILFCGGGRFDLLVALDDRTKLQKLEKKLQTWLLREFYGELGIQIARTQVLSADFGDMARVYAALDDDLVRKKRQKFREFAQGEYALGDQDFFAPKEQRYHACSACHLTALPDPGICQPCQEHLRIGRKLPDTDYLAYLYGDVEVDFPKEAVVVEFPDPFGVRVALLDHGEAGQFMTGIRDKDVELVSYRLNDTEFLSSKPTQNVAMSFEFLANEAPTAREYLVKRPGQDAVREGDVLGFDRIADMSQGAKLLGVLKADVDYLGLIFGEGVEPRSISRVSTMSNYFDLFFAGWLHQLCRKLAEGWHADPANENELRGKVDGLFYIVYSGGDDLFIVGPWDQTVELAQALYSDFRRYTCHNPNVTLSAGALLVKPHFPVQRFAQLVGERLDWSKKPDEKTMDKDKTTIFDETVRWRDGEESFEQLMVFAKELAKRVEDNQVPRSFVHFLRRLHDQHFPEDDAQDPMWIPKFHYTAARRISKEVLADADLKLLTNVPEMMEHIRIPVSYVSLITRKE